MSGGHHEEKPMMTLGDALSRSLLPPFLFLTALGSQAPWHSCLCFLPLLLRSV